MQSNTWHDLRLNDGRNLRYLEAGAHAGLPVIALHGTPGSGLRFAPAHDHALAAGIRLIAPDRWGYGGSHAARTPTLDAYAEDLEALASHLGIGHFALLAVSGGAPYAAMSARALSRRIAALALVSPVGPMFQRPSTNNGLFHRFCFLVLPRVPGAVSAIFHPYRHLVRRWPEPAVQAAALRAPPADRLILSNPRRRRDLAHAYAAGLETGVCGPAIDMSLFSRPWRTTPLRDAPTRIWIGTRDANVPLGAVRHLAEDAGAECVEVPSAGHLWLSEAWEEVFEWIASNANARARP